MTSIQQFIKDLQEHFPKQMKDMWENNQFLLEDIALKAKQMHKQEIVEAHESGVDSVEHGYGLDYYNETFKSE